MLLRLLKRVNFWLALASAALGIWRLPIVQREIKPRIVRQINAWRGQQTDISSQSASAG
jgi:hypothetical protein